MVRIALHLGVTGDAFPTLEQPLGAHMRSFGTPGPPLGPRSAQQYSKANFCVIMS